MILDSVGRISLHYLEALSVYTLTLRFLFHLLPQNAELHHFTNSFPPLSPFSRWNNWECLFKSEFRQTSFALSFLWSPVSWDILCGWVSLSCSQHTVFPHRSNFKTERLLHHSGLWQSVEGKSCFVASLACLKIWEQASWLFFHWKQQVAYSFEGSNSVTIFNSSTKSLFS